MTQADTTGSSGLDAAALHPDLHQHDDGTYYRDCAESRERIKAALSSALKIEHQHYLVSNTTHALLVAMAGLASVGQTVDTLHSRYPIYRDLACHGGEYGDGHTVSLITHIDPVFGTISAVPQYHESPFILDAAQSFGTITFHRQALQSPIVLAPLHKHCGIGTGIGILGLDHSRCPRALIEFARVAEAGTTALDTLLSAEQRLKRAEGRVVNGLVLPSSSRFAAAIRDEGVELVSPQGAGLPFMSFRGLSVKLAVAAAAPLGLSVKCFKEQAITRISGAVRSRLNDQPLDRGEALENALLHVLRKNHERQRHPSGPDAGIHRCADPELRSLVDLASR